MQMVPEGDPMVAIDWLTFRRVREHLFGICIMWCAHTGAEMRRKATDVMQGINTREFREAEQRQLGDLSNELEIPGLLQEGADEGVVRELFWTSRLTAVLQQNHESYHRVLAWAWSRLVCRWNVFGEGKPSVGMAGTQQWASVFLEWRNNLRFLCLSLRIPWNRPPAKGQTELKCPVQPDAIDAFFEDIFTLIRSPVPDVPLATLNAVEDLHPCTLDRFLTRLRIYENRRLVERLGAKKAERQFRTSLYLSEPVLDLLARVYGQLATAPPDDEQRRPQMIHKLSELFRRMLLDFATSWVPIDGGVKDAKEPPEPPAPHPSNSLPLKCRIYASKLIGYYLTFCATGAEEPGPEGKESPLLTPSQMDHPVPLLTENPSPEFNIRKQFHVEVSHFCEVVFNMLMSWVPSENEGRSKEFSSRDVKHLESAIIYAITAIFRLGAVSDPDFQTQVITSMHRFLERGVHNKDHVIVALTSYLKFNPSCALQFMSASCPEYHLHQSRSVSLARELGTAYFTAICVCWGVVDHELKLSNFRALPWWVNKLPQERILLVCFLFQSSPSPEMRKMVINLANGLASLEAEGLRLRPKEGVLRTSPHASPYIYLESAFKYSQSLASSYKHLTAPLLMDLIRMNEGLDIANREWMLRMILPWVGNFSFNLKQERASPSKDPAGASTAVGPTRSILESLFTLTKQNKESRHHLAELWKQLMHNQESVDLVIQQTVEFLLNRHVEARRTGSSEDRSLCSKIIVFMSRTDCRYRILDCIVDHLRNYHQVSMPNDESFLEWHTARGRVKESYNEQEQSSFELLADFVYEHDAATRDKSYLPIVLQNAFVISVAWGGAARDRPDRELLLNLVGGESAIGSETFMSGNLVSDKFVTSIVESLLPQMPKLRAEWAKVAYRWAVITKDKDISLVSWQIFSFLNQDTSYRMMKDLVKNLHMAVSMHEYDAVKVLLGMLANPVNERGFPPQTMQEASPWGLAASVGFGALSTTRVSIFQLALKLIKKAYDAVPASKGHLTATLTARPRAAERRDRMIDLAEMWHLDDCSMGVAICDVLNRGLLNKSTFDATVTTLKILVKEYGEHFRDVDDTAALLPKHDNPILMTLVITYFVQICLGKPDAREQALKFTQEEELHDLALEVEAFSTFDEVDEDGGDSTEHGGIFQEGAAAKTKAATDAMKEFVTKFTNAFIMFFSDDTAWQVSVDIVLHMLRCGHRDWAIPLLRILKVFLEQKPFLWTEDKFRLVTETVQELSSTTDKALMECAEEVTTVLMKKGKPGLLNSCTGVFNFLHNQAAVRELRARAAGKSSDTFAHYSVQEAKLADKRFSDKIQHHSLKVAMRRGGDEGPMEAWESELELEAQLGMVDNLEGFGIDSLGSPPETPVRLKEEGESRESRRELGRPIDNPVSSRRSVDRSPPRKPPVPAMESFPGTPKESLRGSHSPRRKQDDDDDRSDLRSNSYSSSETDSTSGSDTDTEESDEESESPINSTRSSMGGGGETRSGTLSTDQTGSRTSFPTRSTLGEATLDRGAKEEQERRAIERQAEKTRESEVERVRAEAEVAEEAEKQEEAVKQKAEEEATAAAAAAAAAEAAEAHRKEEEAAKRQEDEEAAAQVVMEKEWEQAALVLQGGMRGRDARQSAKTQLKIEAEEEAAAAAVEAEAKEAKQKEEADNKLAEAKEAKQKEEADNKLAEEKAAAKRLAEDAAAAKKAADEVAAAEKAAEDAAAAKKAADDEAAAAAAAAEEVAAARKAADEAAAVAEQAKKDEEREAARREAIAEANRLIQDESEASPAATPTAAAATAAAAKPTEFQSRQQQEEDLLRQAELRRKARKDQKKKAEEERRRTDAEAQAAAEAEAAAAAEAARASEMAHEERLARDAAEAAEAAEALSAKKAELEKAREGARQAEKEKENAVLPSPKPGKLPSPKPGKPLPSPKPGPAGLRSKPSPTVPDAEPVEEGSHTGGDTTETEQGETTETEYVTTEGDEEDEDNTDYTTGSSDSEAEYDDDERVAAAAAAKSASRSLGRSSRSPARQASSKSPSAGRRGVMPGGHRKV